MKKLVLILIIFLSSLSLPQNEPYFDTPFGFGGGFLPMWIVPKVDGFNQQLKAFGSGELSASGMYGSGGAGFAYIMVVPNLRVGGLGVGAVKKEASFSNNYKREIQYTSGFGGLTIEYTLPFIKSVGVSIGGIIGGGNTTIELFRNNNSLSWDNLWSDISDPAKSTDYYSRKIYSNYFVLAPTLNIDIPFYRFMSFRLGVGHTFTFMDNKDGWKFDNEQDLYNVPSDMSNDQLFIQTGIFFGFFSY